MAWLLSLKYQDYLMDFVHCNACQCAPSPVHKSFWFTNCMHIYCKKCVEKLRINASKAVQCVHCKKPCQVIEIGPNMPPKVKKLFTPLEKTLKEQAERMKRVLKFQADQLDSMMGFAKKEKEMLKKAGKAFQAARTQLTTMAKEKTELEGQVTYHKKRLEEFERHIKELQATIHAGRRNPVPPGMARGPPSFLNVTSQSDPTSFFANDVSMLSDLNMSLDSQLHCRTGFVPGSEPCTPICSQISTGEMTTPRILGLPKKPAGVRSDNPYMANWNRTSVERQKKASGGGGGGGVNRAKSTDITTTSESPLAKIPGRKPPTGK